MRKPDIQHRVWIGTDYDKVGINGEKVVIFGFSHHGEDEKAEFTVDLMDSAKRGEIVFFNQLAGFFGRDSTDGFWDEVAFANTLPCLVGSLEARYAPGSAAQRAAVPARIRAILSELKPCKALVFTKRGWDIWPAFDGIVPEGVLRANDGEEIWFGSYRLQDGSTTLAYQIRHPQFARSAQMVSMVQTALAHNP